MAGYIGMPAEKANSVAGIINFMRNIGSSVGTSIVTTLLARRLQVHQVALSQHTTPFDLSFQNRVKALSPLLVHSGASVADAPKLAYGLLYRFVEGQAVTLAYIDIFIDAHHRGEHHVCAFLHCSQERSQGRWRSGCRLAKLCEEAVE
jgi:DHA2 family multidrug resistance protein